MSGEVDNYATILGPWCGDAAGSMTNTPAERRIVLLQGTGAVCVSSAALLPGKIYTIKNGSAALYIGHLSAPGDATSITSANGIPIGPLERYDWKVESPAPYLVIRALSGSGAFDCKLWMSSPGAQ